MSDTIREQIISAIVTAAAGITTGNGYNVSLGTNVYRAVKSYDADSALVVLPQPETVERAHGIKMHNMPVRLEGFSDIGSSNHSEISEQILGDLIEFMTAPVFTLAFTSGSEEVEVGDSITGATSGATAYVCGVSVSSGTWAGGDAAGNLTLRRKSGDFSNENLDVGGDVNVASTNGSISAQNALARVTSDLADDIDYVDGGTDEPPDGSAVSAGTYAIFNVYYETMHGNPYGQPS